MSKSYLDKLIWQFPEFERNIRRLHETDTHFRSLCQKMEATELALQDAADVPDQSARFTRELGLLRDEAMKHMARETRGQFVREIKKGTLDNERNS